MGAYFLIAFRYVRGSHNQLIQGIVEVGDINEPIHQSFVKAIVSLGGMSDCIDQIRVLDEPLQHVLVCLVLLIALIQIPNKISLELLKPHHHDMGYPPMSRIFDLQFQLFNNFYEPENIFIDFYLQLSPHHPIHHIVSEQLFIVHCQVVDEFEVLRSGFVIQLRKLFS